MLLVVLSHCKALIPETETGAGYSTNYQLITSILCAIYAPCVYAFVMISGWFSIKFTIKGLCKFIFQCLFFIAGVQIFALSVGAIKFNFTTILECLVISHAAWFVLCYLGLFIIAPILNAFIEHATKKEITTTIIAMLVIHSIYGTSEAAVYIVRGYSVFSFSLVYLIGRYLNKYHVNLAMGKYIWISATIIDAILFFITLRLNCFTGNYALRAFSNPLILCEAVGLFMIFANIKMKPSKFINFVAASAFACYLLHSTTSIGWTTYTSYAIYLKETYFGMEYILRLFCLIMFVFWLGILLDQPRKWI